MGHRERNPVAGGRHEPPAEPLDPSHFYAAYVFDRAEGRRHDVVALIEQARRLGYPARYWWLSDAVDLRDAPDRLIVCVHHPAPGVDAGMDLFQALQQERVAWDDLEAASVDEYRQLSRPILGPGGIARPDGAPLFPPPAMRAVRERAGAQDDEHEPLFSLTRGVLQAVARDALGRDLTEAETRAVVAHLPGAVNWAAAVRAAITAGQQLGTVGPGVADASDDDPSFHLTPPEAPPPLLEDGPQSQYLVYYSLSGLMLIAASDDREASRSVFGSLHALIGKMGREGVTPEEATRVRLGELEIDIDSVEALEFPADPA